MCGIVLTHGDKHQILAQQLIAKLSHRGPDGTNFYHTDALSIAFSRLAINDADNGKQPCHCGDWVTATNGEIYNHARIKAQYRLDYQGHCDTQLIAPLFALLGSDILQVLDGFYSAILYNTSTQQLFSLRDYIGKKPLFLVTSGAHTIITSELKAISKIDTFQIIPKGLCQIDLAQRAITHIQEHENIHTAEEMQKNTLPLLLKQAVEKRIPPPAINFGAFISGGIDSAIIAKLLTKITKKANFYLLANKDSVDYEYAQSLFKALNISNARIITLPAENEFPALIEKIVFITESYNPSIISNGICYYLLSRAALQDGCKIVLCGEGADEIFGGYHQSLAKEKWHEVKQKLLADLYFTELRRVDLTCMHHHIEARLPYLDRAIHAYAEHLHYEDFYHAEHNKYILRQSFAGALPDEIIWRKKTSADVGSGIRKMVVSYLTEKYGNEKSALRDIWCHHFPHQHLADHAYFHRYPSFDAAIQKRGHQHVY